jgi:ribosomal protein S18 acetylase RimI-like enzyme
MSALEFEIRRMHPSELEAVDRLVYFIVDEVFDGWMNPSPMPLEPGDWLPSWVVVANGKIVGMMMTGGPWLEALWLEAGFRGMGLGTRLLEIAEREICERGMVVARLRVTQTLIRAVGF